MSRQIQVPVTVAVRIRPLNSREISYEGQGNGEEECITCTSRDQLQLSNNKVFRFDRVFPPTSNQVTLYTELVYPLLLKCFEGINCTVFAYGQTGSGKTYTLGSEGTSLNRGGPHEGIISRTLTDMFTYVKEKEKEGPIKCCISYVEIYKEEIRDLLAEDEETIINIREDETGHTVLMGVVEEEVSLLEEALNLLEIGNAIRVTSATEMNTHSSRSHAIFILTLIQEKRIHLPTAVLPSDKRQLETPQQERGQTPFCTTKLISKFHFVDLAGSERVNRTHNTGERFKESVHINGGLLALGNVITALADNRRKSSHVPYRDSKITRLLKDSLGGHAHTLMITCLSPCERDLPETLNTLKYAKRARNIKNHPIVNQDPHTASVIAMRDEIESLRHKLQQLAMPFNYETTPTNGEDLIVDFDQQIVDLNRQITDLKSKLDSFQSQYQSVCLILNKIKDKVLVMIKDDSSNQLLLEIAQLSEYGKDYGHDTEYKENEVIDKTINEEKKYKEALQTIELLQNEIQTYQSDLLADEDIFAEKEREYTQLQQQYELSLEENKHMQLLVSQLREKEDELTNKVEELESQFLLLQSTPPKVTQEIKEKVTEKVTQEVTKGQSDDITKSLDWIDRVYEAIHDKIDLTFINKDVSHESCDLALHHLTSLLTSNDDDDVIMMSHDVIQESHDPEEDYEVAELRESLLDSQEKLKEMEKWFAQEQHKIQSLTLKIKFKEELIHELIKNNKAIHSLNSAYQKKITCLENEATLLKQKIEQTDGCHGNDDATTRIQLEAKLKETRLKMTTLQKRRKETLRLLETKGKGERKSEGRLRELEGELERLRNKQTQLVHRVKEEGEKKKNLEKEIEKCQKKVAKLTRLTERQSHVLKVKTEEVAIAQRKLRNIKRPSTIQQTPLTNSKHNKWFEEEIKKLRNEKRALDKLQKDIQDRELLVSQHEELLKEKILLQRNRDCPPSSSNNNILHLSIQLNTLDDLIRKKETLRDSLDEQSLSDGSNDLHAEIKRLKEKHKCISEKKQILQQQLNTGANSCDENETRILELQEQIEVLETSLQLKMNSVYQRVLPQCQELINLTSKINQLTHDEMQSLLVQSILRILTLEGDLGEKEDEQERLVSQVSQEKENIEILKQSLTQLQFDKQWKLDKSRKEHAQEMGQLLSHMTNEIEESNDIQKQPQSSLTTDKSSEEDISLMTTKIKALEKDLYFYKKTSRDLRQQLNHLTKSN